MINNIELTNFKRHESLAIAFTEGLNVIRAASEAGKSTVYDAIGYAFWGSRALPLSLDETVTWGKPTSSLKVKLIFTLNNVCFTITRSKSGAELSAEGLLVSGQAEVTAFVERLLGASAAVGEATLMASQGKLQNGLDSSAVSLIEKLSNMALIDTVVGKIQDTLPSGNTKLVENIIAGYAELAVPITSLVVEEQVERRASVSVVEAKSKASALQVEFTSLEESVTLALRQVELAKTQTFQLAQAELQLAKYQSEVRPMPEPLTGPTLAELAGLQHTQEAEVKLLKAFNAFRAYAPPVERHDSVWFDEKITDTELKLADYNKYVIECKVKAAQIKASGIYEDSCALCGKFLIDVPEVVAINLKVSTELANLDRREIQAIAYISDLTDTLARLKAIRRVDHNTELLAQTCRGYVSVDKTSRPYLLTWTAAKPSEASPVDYAMLISARVVAEKTRDRQVASIEEANKHVEKLTNALKTLALVEIPETTYEAIAYYKELSITIGLQLSELQKAEAEHRLALSQLESARTLVKFKLQRHAEALAEKATAEVSYLEMTFHNELIKKLRAARPAVARELWGMVLQGVSTVFSQIRGVPSVVTRSDDKFLVDGRLSGAYSGSTKDSLGLAIRIMLQKTFLGTVDFILLDEPAAGCDVVREADMIASVTRADYWQVILVTHSEVADVFANNIITL